MGHLLKVFVHFVVARKIAFKKGSNEQKPWIKGIGTCTGKISVENSVSEFYYSNFSGIDYLHRKFKKIRFYYIKNYNRRIYKYA